VYTRGTIYGGLSPAELRKRRKAWLSDVGRRVRG
jgi:hypothetical protein